MSAAHAMSACVYRKYSMPSRWRRTSQSFMSAAAISVPQPWPITVDGGVSAVGFHPIAPSPMGSLGTEIRLHTRKIYALNLGVAAGAFTRPTFQRGLFLDASLNQRWTAPFGLYGDLDVIVGSVGSRFPGIVYRLEDGELQPQRASVRLAARLGLGVAIGYDLSRVTRQPIRIFVRYRQYATAPFMPGNDVPAMGIASFTAGFAMEIGTWTRR